MWRPSRFPAEMPSSFCKTLARGLIGRHRRRRLCSTLTAHGRSERWGAESRLAARQCAFGCGSTVIRIRHEGNPRRPRVPCIVTYVKDGKLHNVRAKAVDARLAAGCQSPNLVARICPTASRAGVLTVPLRPGAHGERSGSTLAILRCAGACSVARWFSGLGWHLCVRRNVSFGGTYSTADAEQPDRADLLRSRFSIPTVDPAAQGSCAARPDTRHALRRTTSARFANK